LGSAEGEIWIITTVVPSFLQGKIQINDLDFWFKLKDLQLDLKALTYFKSEP